MAYRVLIVDDSSFFRKRLTDIITSDPNLVVVGIAEDGEQAVKQAKALKPDIITMDIEMPKMDGITAVRHIMAESPTAILVLSSVSIEGAKATFQALDAGAVDYMPKRFENITKDQVFAQKKLCKRLYNLALSYHHQDAATKIPIKKSVSPSSPSNIKLVAIGTSTGGPIALQRILSQLPANFPHPLLVIQHMPAAFTPSFSERLNTQCAIRVKQAENGDELMPGVAYIAPGGRQMLLQGTKSQPTIKILDGQPDQTYQPCIDTTFGSIADLCPAETLAIILTGMGSDGREGCRRLKQLNAIVWSQDEQSSTIYGMPMAVAKAKLTDRVLSLSNIGQQLTEMKV